MFNRSCNRCKRLTDGGMLYCAGCAGRLTPRLRWWLSLYEPGKDDQRRFIKVINCFFWIMEKRRAKCPA